MAHVNPAESSVAAAGVERGRNHAQPERCAICWNDSFVLEPVLWPQLVLDWQLSPGEASHIDQQQGLRCSACRCNLRSMTLAAAIMQAAGDARCPFREFVAMSRPARDVRLLEINDAGDLTPYLRLFRDYNQVSFPGTDMQDMHRIPAASFDVVVHSDTLEHVPQPAQALRECRRILRPGGFLAYTVPIVVGRLGRRRDGLSPSFHGAPETDADDMRVITEYGADFWSEPMLAGFRTVVLHSVMFPASVGVVARP